MSFRQFGDSRGVPQSSENNARVEQSSQAADSNAIIEVQGKFEGERASTGDDVNIPYRMPITIQ